jgi:hypothetical protein
MKSHKCAGTPCKMTDSEIDFQNVTHGDQAFVLNSLQRKLI